MRKATLDRGVTVWTDGTLVPANGSVQSSFADVSVAEELTPAAARALLAVLRKATGNVESVEQRSEQDTP